MGQSKSKKGTATSFQERHELTEAELVEMTTRFEAYRPLKEETKSGTLLGLPNVLWEMYLLPLALTERNDAACWSCKVEVSLETLRALRCTCRTIYAMLRKQSVWKRVLCAQFDKPTVEAWMCLYERSRSGKPSKLADRHAFFGTYNKGQAEKDMKQSLQYARPQEHDILQKRWRFFHARRVAMEAWLGDKCLEEQMWLIVWLRSPVVTRISLANADKAPFHAGDQIALDIHIEPARRNMCVSLKNGQIGKRCGPDPEDDFLTQGSAFMRFDGQSPVHSERHPNFFGHGCVSAYSDSLKGIGHVRRLQPCAVNKKGRVPCPQTTTFRTEGRLMYRVRNDGYYGLSFQEKRPEKTPFDLVIEFANAALIVADDADGKVAVLGYYCHHWQGTDNYYCRAPEALIGFYHRGEEQKVLLEDGSECPSADRIRTGVYCDSILSQVLHIPIAESCPSSRAAATVVDDCED